MQILTRRTLCACCREFMKVGEEFRWQEKQVAVGWKVSSGSKTVYRPAHKDPLCWQKKAMIEDLVREVSANLASIESLKAVNAPDEVLDLFRAKVDEARSKLTAMEK